MKAKLITYHGEHVDNVELVELPDDYDGDAYGDKVPFTVGSNQAIITEHQIGFDKFQVAGEISGVENADEY